MSTYEKVPSSFRDPSGFLFYQGNNLYRQINLSYKQEFDQLINSGLYEKLVSSNQLISHEEVNITPLEAEYAYKVIKPEKIPFISYPYEWCFSELKQAAITTLEIQKTAMDFDMTLKDCSAYNIQFKNGKPILIDTLSFEKYQERQIWKPYRQFCQHFLAPLALMSHKDVRLNQLFRIYIDGIPLDLTASLLPFKTRSMFSLLTHIHAHAKSQKHFRNKEIKLKDQKLAKRSFLGIVESVFSAIKKLEWTPKGTEWADYYSDTNYTELGFEQKKELITKWLEKIKPKVAWDLGANTGIFSRIASEKGIETISFDIDPAAVEKNYLEILRNKESKILPLLMDLSNPSPNLGWESQERESLIDRGPSDVVLALALIHHLIISNNVPLKKLALFFKKICKHLIIEFIPKTDSQVQRLLVSREDIFDDYTKEKFENGFSKFFKIEETINITDSERIFYLMKNINS